MKNEYYYLDLFHGIGGFPYGAYKAGMRFKDHYCSDIDPYCQKLYEKRFPESIQLGDITKIDTSKLPKGKWILTGGFPCQDLSIAGKGVGLHGKRSGLWYQYLRIIGDLQPEFAIMENVSAIVGWFDIKRRSSPPENFNEGDRWEVDVEQYQGLATVIGDLAEIGYNAEWQDIRAADMGAPHKRDREWIVAYPNGERYLHGQIEEFPTETGIDAQRNISTESKNVAHSDRDGRNEMSQRESLKGSESRSPVVIQGKRENRPQGPTILKDDFPDTKNRNERLSSGKGSEFPELGIICEDEFPHTDCERCQEPCNGITKKPELVNSGHGKNALSVTGSVWQAERGDGRLSESSQIKRSRENNGAGKTINELGEWWAVEPNVGRLANGVPSRVDRLRGDGNAIVPQIARILFEQIKPFL